MTIRVLGLGNDLLADDGFGVEVVRELSTTLPGAVETRLSIASGFALLDDVLESDHLIVVDTIVTGRAAPGTVHRFQLGQVGPVGELGQVGPVACGTGVSPVIEELGPVRAPVGQGFSLAEPAPGQSPHYVGLFETLRLGHELGLRVPGQVVILAVEAGDCLTIGGQMSNDVRAAKPAVRQAVEQMVSEWERPGGLRSGAEKAIT